MQATGGSSHCGGMHLDSLILTFIFKKLEDGGLGIGLQVILAAVSCDVSAYVAGDSGTLKGLPS